MSKVLSIVLFAYESDISGGGGSLDRDPSTATSLESFSPYAVRLMFS